MEKEKQSRLKNKILKILPKAAAAVTFQNPPFSPGRDHKLRSEKPKGFSGPMIPHEARRKPKDNGHGGIETQEPTSPKISCMGQIKHKKKKQIKKGRAMSMTSLPPSHSSTAPTPRDTTTNNNKNASRFQRMFLQAAKPKNVPRKPYVSASSDDVSDKAPPLGHMRRFASGRETFSNFDWKAQITPEEERGCYTDDDRMESDADDDVIIPFSAPIMVGSGGAASNFQPRKEINLWKRRTMEPPRPLQLNPILTVK
ncbi:hypothetical protein RJT34_25853 [Clitoria ternatea]|uniref:Syringolide-induced protein 14-1-1 n=1 Tax=Clitoria ternatea TaxID=43366 RepID=A0AAN9FTB2_CLITE